MTVSKVTTQTSLLFGAVAILLGGFIGWGIANISVSNGMGSASPIVGIGGGPTEKSPKFEDLIGEHNDLIIIYLQSLYDKKDAVTIEKQLDSNSNKLSNLISDKFGEAAGAEFLYMWRDQITQYSHYTKGLKLNDGDKMQMSKQRLEKLAIERGFALHNLNQNISAEELANMNNEHNVLILSIMDSYAKGDQENVITHMNELKNQSVKLISYLTQNLFSYSLSLTAPQ